MSSAVRGPSSLLFLGGITCAGKSTVACTLAERHGLVHYRTDDTFNNHAKLADRERHPAMWRYQNEEDVWKQMSRTLKGAAWARVQHQHYRERFDFIMKDVSEIDGPVIVDGVDLLPESVVTVAPPERAVWLVSTRRFVNRHYTERPWAEAPPDDDGWDYYRFFRRGIRAQARRHGLKVITVGVSTPQEETVAAVEDHFGLQETL